ncbi:MBL fold metallo-hydrolase [Paraliomyxa miuraensis]|uniref:MBL fold metallo-hydrolase n=1 Tax=Paraliomyxa miuraensis TaxID=376150 RepID=UPI002256D13F|nr:MBL fold metallo-hydrolase [Paraliomyxa miuraensis]MCX4240012.1 MBL fold metallo-hydrolase [Paraliomyxa miuraensis]
MTLQRSIIALIAPLALAACATAARPVPPPTLQITAYAAAPANGRVNSYLVTGRTKAMLVDAQLVRSETEKVIAMVRASGKELETIVVTHAHPDHFMGLAQLHAAFPSARIVARPEVVEALPEAFDRFVPLLEKFFPGDVADALVMPEVLSQPHLQLEGVDIEVLDFHEGESEYVSALVIPSMQAVLCSDMAYNHVHPWLNELRFDGVREHARALQELPGVQTVYPGHGGPMTKPQLQEYITYVDEFLQVAEGASDTKAIVDAMSAKHPDYEALAGLRFSASAFVQAREVEAQPAADSSTATP